MNTPVGSRAALEHEMQILKFREHRILTKIIEYEQAPEDELYLNSVLDMRQPAGRGDKKIDGARQQMGMYSKDSAFARVLKLQDALYKVQGRIAKIADSLRALEENEKRLELEKKRLEILRMRATGVVETPDPETGEDLPDEVDGEFCAKGYNIMKGYYKMPEATAAAIDKDGWLHTGDLARRTPEGNFKITGRIKDMIIRGGENIYPKEIEDFIYTHPKVRDVQVIGVPDEQYGEEIMAVVILKEGETSSEEEIKDYVRTHMAKHKVPRYVSFVKEFPMNAAGKILKYKMREDAVELLKLQKANSIVTA